MVQRCVDVLAGSSVSRDLPAGTAILFAVESRHPADIEKAVAIGLRGDRREIDVGKFNGERFAVMAGAGFDAAMIRDAGDGGLKDRFGRAAYVLTGSENLRMKPFRAKIEVDGAEWFKGKASCILLGNVGKLFGGLEAFEDARVDDGKLEIGVVTADGSARLVANDRARSCRVRRRNRRSRRRRRRATVKVKLRAEGRLRARRSTGRRRSCSRSRSSPGQSTSTFPSTREELP